MSENQKTESFNNERETLLIILEATGWGAVFGTIVMFLCVIAGALLAR